MESTSPGLRVGLNDETSSTSPTTGVTQTLCLDSIGSSSPRMVTLDAGNPHSSCASRSAASRAVSPGSRRPPGSATSPPCLLSFALRRVSRTASWSEEEEEDALFGAGGWFDVDVGGAGGVAERKSGTSTAAAGAPLDGGGGAMSRSRRRSAASSACAIASADLADGRNRECGKWKWRGITNPRIGILPRRETVGKQSGKRFLPFPSPSPTLPHSLGRRSSCLPVRMASRSTCTVPSRYGYGSGTIAKTSLLASSSQLVRPLPSYGVRLRGGASRRASIRRAIGIGSRNVSVRASGGGGNDGGRDPQGGSPEWIDAPLVLVDALSVYTTCHASERIASSEMPVVASLLVAAWWVCAAARRDYAADAAFRDLVWDPAGPMKSGLVGGLKTWLAFAPVATLSFCGVALALGYDVGNYASPPPEGWAPPFLEVVEATAIVTPVARGVLATLWMY